MRLSFLYEGRASLEIVVYTYTLCGRFTYVVFAYWTKYGYGFVSREFPMCIHIYISKAKFVHHISCWISCFQFHNKWMHANKFQKTQAHWIFSTFSYLFVDDAHMNRYFLQSFELLRWDFNIFFFSILYTFYTLLILYNLWNNRSSQLHCYKHLAYLSFSINDKWIEKKNDNKKYFRHFILCGFTCHNTWIMLHQRVTK